MHWAAGPRSNAAFGRTMLAAALVAGATAIVGDTDGRYFEPSATRNVLLGMSASASF